jgi:hypothetical protein
MRYVKAVGATVLLLMLASTHARAESTDPGISINLRGSVSPFEPARVQAEDDDSESGGEKEAPVTTKTSNSNGKQKSANGEEASDTAGKHVTFETAVDFTTHGGYEVSTESFIAPFTDLETSGFRLSINTAVGGGMHHNGETGELNRGTYTTAALLFGYAIEVEKLSMKFMIGPNLEDHKLSEPDPTNPVQGIALGMKFKWEVTYNPKDYLLVYSDISYSTAFSSYYAQFKFGYDVAPPKGDQGRVTAALPERHGEPILPASPRRSSELSSALLTIRPRLRLLSDIGSGACREPAKSKQHQGYRLNAAFPSAPVERANRGMEADQHARRRAALVLPAGGLRASTQRALRHMARNVQYSARAHSRAMAAYAAPVVGRRRGDGAVQRRQPTDHVPGDFLR